jgi:hypothetical protein
MGLKWTYLLIFVLFFKNLNSQSKVLDTSFVREFPNKITTRIGLINTSNSFFINDEASALRYNLKPNTREYLGISILFRSIELDFGFLPDFLKDNKDNSDSKLFNLNLRMFLGQWMQTVDLYNQKGFFLDLEDFEIPLPSVRTFKFGGSTSYIFNPNFSFRAIGFQNEWQKKSAGSFIPRLFYYYTTFDIEDSGSSDNATSFDIAIAPSYYYNFVFKKHFILGLGTLIGIGYNTNNLGERTINSVLLEYGGRAVLGYNSETFFAGVNSSINFFEHNSDRSVRVDDTLTFVEFYLGYRFKAPKSFIKTADKVNNALGL